MGVERRRPEVACAARIRPSRARRGPAAGGTSRASRRAMERRGVCERGGGGAAAAQIGVELAFGPRTAAAVAAGRAAQPLAVSATQTRA